MSVAKKGQHPVNEFKNGCTPFNKGKKLNEFISKEVNEMRKKKISKRMKKVIMKGKNHHNWKGGLTTINQKIRHSEEYKLWRLAVFKRDKYNCRF